MAGPYRRRTFLKQLTRGAVSEEVVTPTHTDAESREFASYIESRLGYPFVVEWLPGYHSTTLTRFDGATATVDTIVDETRHYPSQKQELVLWWLCESHRQAHCCRHGRK